MAKIHSLESSLVDQIAAGEVIDRPASVVKELIENSLDDGSDKINVQINKGGHELIYVSDNGCGMNRQDLIFAFKVVKHVKSNAVVLVNNKRTIGIGSGQTSRIDSTKIALSKIVQSGKILWILDEPFANLDGKGTAFLISEIQSHLNHGGMLISTENTEQPIIDSDINFNLDAP